MTALAGALLRGEKSGRPLWRRLLLTLTIIAFAQANYLTQTHLHPLAAPASTTASGQSPHGKAPERDDPANCPLCQEYVIAGVYISPAPIVLPLPALTTFAVLQVVRALPFIAAVSHGWRGRAPPPH